VSLIRWISLLALVLLVPSARSQSATTPASPPAPAESLPDSPGTVLQQATHPTEDSVIVIAEASYSANGTALPPCSISRWRFRPRDETPADAQSRKSCIDILNPYTRFLDTKMIIPMTPRQKGYLAVRNFTDPFNLATVAATSGFSVAIDPHSAYGPGWPGFAKSAGVSLLQDASGEFFGTWLIPSIVHEDPRYHRMPDASVPRRLLHAISRPVIAQSDLGAPMPNYATLLTYPIVAEISNLYVPGIHSNGPSTVARVATGLALDPVDSLIEEFLPDVAKRIHVRIIFVQQILNQVVSDPRVNQ
jgi:hypothetical protein